MKPLLVFVLASNSEPVSFDEPLLIVCKICVLLVAITVMVY